MNDFWYDRPKEVREKISKSQRGNKYRWKPELDKPYAEVKTLVAKGVAVTCACEAVGIKPDQYYRRRRIELTGNDRVKNDAAELQSTRGRNHQGVVSQNRRWTNND